MQKPSPKKGKTYTPPNYNNVHSWLKTNFLKYKCQNTLCNNSSKTLDFALIKGCKYERNRDNFIVLCRKCHKSYDRVIIDKNRLDMIIELRNYGCYWYEIGYLLKMDWRNVARDYKLANKKIIIGK